MEIPATPCPLQTPMPYPCWRPLPWYYQNMSLSPVNQTATPVGAPSEEALENLVNQIAHDVRNYVFAMGLQAELGARRAADPTSAQGHFEAVLRQIDKLKGYLDRLLLFGRPFRPNPSALNPVEFLRELVHQVRAGRAADEPPPTIQVIVPGEIDLVFWDRRGMYEALAAVLDNAVRSAPHPPPVYVTVEAAGEWVRMSVRDEGLGIDAATLAALSVPMGARRPGGAGLGLAIARKIIAAHGGKLTVATGNTGTTVCMELPREAPAG